MSTNSTSTAPNGALGAASLISVLAALGSQHLASRPHLTMEPKLGAMVVQVGAQAEIPSSLTQSITHHLYI